jgi:hypothetical protein
MASMAAVTIFSLVIGKSCSDRSIESRDAYPSGSDGNLQTDKSDVQRQSSGIAERAAT